MCLNLIKKSYEMLLKMSINQMMQQNESLRQQVKQLMKQSPTPTQTQGKKTTLGKP